MLLHELWQEASKYGKVSLHTYATGMVWAYINFDTTQGVTLKVESEFVSTPEEALTKCISKAVNIVATFGNNRAVLAAPEDMGDSNDFPF